MESIDDGEYEPDLRRLMSMDPSELKELYRNREIEPENAPEDWTPASNVLR